MDADALGRLTYLLLLGLVVGGWFFAQNRQSLNRNLQQAILWLFLFAGVAVLYGLKDDLRLAVGHEASVKVSDDKIVLSRAGDGHFYATLAINGRNMVFVVDTGATEIVLNRSDAAAAGLNPDELAYFGSAQTANGTVRTARVKLDTVELGPVEDRNVTAWVNDGDLDTSLLGMGYLSRFARIEIAGDRMYLSR